VAARPLPASISVEEPSSFAEVFRAELSYVCRTLRRFGVREADLEDVAQEVFLAVHRRFHERDPERPVRPWLVSFAYRFAANYARLARHRVQHGLRETEPSREGSPEERASDRQAQALVLAALQHVRLERRPVLTMHDIDGFSPSEIAFALGIPVNTVYSRLRLARAELRDAVRALQEDAR
jgi:RNA polymerase sigma-70 factor (ECF subfamily)